MQILRKRDGRLAKKRSRAGVSTVDYALLLGIILPLAAFAIPKGKRIIELTYDMIRVMVGWPFM